MNSGLIEKSSTKSTTMESSSIIEEPIEDSGFMDLFVEQALICQQEEKENEKNRVNDNPLEIYINPKYPEYHYTPHINLNDDPNKIFFNKYSGNLPFIGHPLLGKIM
jgi:hypothetical protein